MAKPSLFIKKSLTALVLAPLTIAIIYYGYPWLHLSLMVIGALLAWEWSSMVPNKNAVIYSLSYLLALVFTMFIGPVFVSISGVLAVMFFVWFKAKNEENKKLLAFGVPYIAIGMGAIAWLVMDDALVFIWLLLAVWCTDIGGYVFGCSIKGPKLAPKISPNKTWSGFLGGMFLSMIMSLLFLIFVLKAYNGFNVGVFLFVVMGAYVAILAQVGDLLESAIKRRLGIKDSSDLIPGHGGMFDRLDSLLFAVPCFVLTTVLIEICLVWLGY